MNRSLAFTSTIRSTSVAGTMILAACLTSSLTLAASDHPATDNPKALAQKAHAPAGAKNPGPRAAAKPAVATRPANQPGSPSAKPASGNEPQNDVAALKERLNRQDELLAAQQQQIALLRQAIEDQKQLLQRAVQAAPVQPPLAPNLGQVASLAPVIPAVSPAPVVASLAPVIPVASSASAIAAAGPAPVTGSPGPAPQETTRSYVERVDQLGKTVDTTVANLAGFRFSGDFRLRFDSLDRSSNSVAAAEQNSRGNYRLRFNIDKVLNDQFNFHFQVASGDANNPLTYNTDFGGFATRGPIFIGEAWASYHPNSNIDLLGGRVPELFADDSRFLFKEDIRFDGVQQNFKIPVGSNPLGVTRIELRAGQYVLTNPNVPALPSAKNCASATPPTSCVYLNAGYLPGQRVEDADLFHQGFAIYADLKPGWHHQFGGDLQWYRNPNQIALAATAAGAPVVIGAQFGTSSILPIPGTGTATTTAGGAMFTAANFQVAHLKYRLGYDGWKVKDHELPAYIEFHAARNVGTGFLNNAWEGLLNFGSVTKAGDVRLLYAYAEKEANSMISEVTDDYLGSTSGVNMRTHEIRVDVGLNRYLVWQNLFFIQNEISSNDPKRNFFVPVQVGAATQYRLQTQVQFSF
ncbi:MAG: putative porin [Terriglobia bacterium]